MNCRYFACADCKKRVDAGYRWAYWCLEDTEIVRLGEPVSAEKVLAAKDYWEPPPEKPIEDVPPTPQAVLDWLEKQCLPAVRCFLIEHGQHSLLYLEEEEFYPSSARGDYEEIPT